MKKYSLTRSSSSKACGSDDILANATARSVFVETLADRAAIASASAQTLETLNASVFWLNSNATKTTPERTATFAAVCNIELTRSRFMHTPRQVRLTTELSGPPDRRQIC